MAKGVKGRKPRGVPTTGTPRRPLGPRRPGHPALRGDTHPLRGHPPRPWVGRPPALPEGGQALLPPPGKGPGSAGRVTLAGWFLIFLARFFSLAPDISGRARGACGQEGHTNPPLKQAVSSQRGLLDLSATGGKAGRGWRAVQRRAEWPPAPSRYAPAARPPPATRGHPNLSTAHARGATARTPTHTSSSKDYISQNPLRGGSGSVCPAALPGGRGEAAVGGALRRGKEGSGSSYGFAREENNQYC